MKNLTTFIFQNGRSSKCKRESIYLLIPDSLDDYERSFRKITYA